MPKKQLIKEKTDFRADEHETPEDRNGRLATYLNGGVWADLHIVSIERIEIGSTKGWRATYRE